MNSAQELERLVVRLVGDGSDYEEVLNDAVSTTEWAATEINTITVGMDAYNEALEEAADVTEAVIAPTRVYAKEVKELDKATTTYNAEVAKARDIMRAVRTPTEQYRVELMEVQKLYDKNMISSRAYTRMVRKLNKEFDQGSYALIKYGNRIQGVARSLQMASMKMSLAITLPVTALGGWFLKAAADAEETKNKFDVVFSSVIKTARNAAKELDAAYGMAATEAENLLANTGDLLTGFGFAQDVALDLSTRVQKLAMDLASFVNLEGGATRASEALTKAILGETEQAKALGIVIRQDSDEFIDLVKHYQEAERMTLLQAKAMAALDIATSQSKNAIGDYARSQQSFTNQTRELMADVVDLATSFGRELIPTFQVLVKWGKQLVTWTEELDPGIKRAILLFAALAAGVAPVLSVLGLMVAGIGGVVSFIGMLGGVTLAAIAPIALLAVKVAAVAAVLAAAGYGAKQLIDYIWGAGSLTDAMGKMLVVGWRWAKNIVGFVWNIGHNFEVLLDWLPRNWQNVVQDMFSLFVWFHKNMINNAFVMVETFVRIYTLWKGWMVGLFRDLFTVNLVNWVLQGLREVSLFLVQFVSAARKGLVSIFVGGGGQNELERLAQQLVSDFNKGMKSQDILGDTAKVVREQVDKLRTPFEGFKSSLEELPAFATDIGIATGDGLAEGVMKAANQIKDEVEKSVMPTLAAATNAGEFKTISLRRFAIEPITGAYTNKKQEVHDTEVAQRLDTLINVVQTKKPVAVLGK